jgi:hypothetical protein
MQTKQTMQTAAALTRPRCQTTPSLARAGATAAITAAVANALLYVAGAPLDLFPQTVLVPGANAPITLARVFVATVVAVAVAAGTLAVLRRRARRPFATFQRVALVVLAVSFTQPPLVLGDAPFRMVLALDALHVVAVAITLWALRGAVVGGRREAAAREATCAAA